MGSFAHVHLQAQNTSAKSMKSMKQSTHSLYKCLLAPPLSWTPPPLSHFHSTAHNLSEVLGNFDDAFRLAVGYRVVVIRKLCHGRVLIVHLPCAQ